MVINGESKQKPRLRQENHHGITLGLDIKRARVAAGFTQEQLAQKVGLSRPTIHRIENGGTDYRLETLLSVLWLLGYELRAMPIETIAAE